MARTPKGNQARWPMERDAFDVPFASIATLTDWMKIKCGQPASEITDRDLLTSVLVLHHDLGRIATALESLARKVRDDE